MHNILSVVAENERYYTLTLDEVIALDAWLKNSYQIDFFHPSSAHVNYAGASAIEKERVAELEKEIGKLERKNKSITPQIALELTDIFSGEHWRGEWHSRRRAWTLDSITVASAIVKQLVKSNKTIQILDVGCNVGFLPTYLATQYNVEVSAIDASKKAIDAAQTLDLKEMVSFVQADIEHYKTRKKWDLVTAIDLVQPTESNFSQIIEKVANLVKSNGHLLLVGNFVEYDIATLLRQYGFSCLNAQLTGGYQPGHRYDGDIDWDTKAAFHFQKTSGIDQFTGNLSDLMSDFADYANYQADERREVNRSYFTAKQLADI